MTVTLPELWKALEDYKKKYQDFIPPKKYFIRLHDKSLDAVPKVVTDKTVLKNMLDFPKGIIAIENVLIFYEYEEEDIINIRWELYQPSKDSTVQKGKGWVSLRETGILDPYWIPAEEREPRTFAKFRVYETLGGNLKIEVGFETTQAAKDALKLVKKAQKIGKKEISHLTGAKSTSSSDRYPTFYLLLYKAKLVGFGTWEIQTKQIPIGYSPIWEELLKQGKKDLVLNELIALSNIV